MMFGYGGSWPFWETGLVTWLGMIAILGLLVWGICAPGDQPEPQARQRSSRRFQPPGSSMSA